MYLKFIEPEIGNLSKNKKKYPPASYLRRSFLVTGKVKRVKLVMTALGVYTGFLNGEPLDNQLLRPGFTDYDHRLQYQTYDLTSRIQQGENVIAVILGDGWYRGTLCEEKRCFYGDKLKLAGRLIIDYSSGERQIIDTDESWIATQNGPIRHQDYKVIESYDATREIPRWNKKGFHPDNKWHACKASYYDGRLIPQEGERLIEQEILTPVLLSDSNGNTILDFGQNHLGHVKFAVNGKAGHKVSLIMGETLDEKGNFTIRNLKPANMLRQINWQRLEYILKDGFQEYKSTFMFSGFRYVLLENWPEEIKPENFKSYAVYSELRETGDFKCSNEYINKLVSNVRWSLKSNFAEIPMDCPQRERAGWTGDINVFCETANYYVRSDQFLGKWICDYISIHKETGEFPYVVPKIPMGETGNGSAGWADAISGVPFMLYKFYGDTTILSRVYDTVRDYVDYNEKRARSKSRKNRRRKDVHLNYILDTGYHYGEWMEPGSNLLLDGIKGVFAPDAEVATAWWFYTTKQLVQMAEILNRPTDQKKYGQLAGKIRNAYRREFTEEGVIHSNRMCKYVRPLYMGLLDPGECEMAAAELNRMCICGGYKIGTGFLTTYQLLPVLSDYGYDDTAYRMLLNSECPGWMYEIRHGATTTWENWLGIDEKGCPHNSLNHYSAGSVVAWLYSYCAGIRAAEPGFSRVRIVPHPGGGLRNVSACYDSCHGRVVVKWKIENDTFELELETPVETVVIMPDGSEHEVGSGTCQFQCKWTEKGENDGQNK